MRNTMLLFTVISSASFALPLSYNQPLNDMSGFYSPVLDNLVPTQPPYRGAPFSHPIKPLNDLRIMLHNEAPSLNQDVINKVIMTLHCANSSQVEHTPILTIIDYSLPSSEKRLWVFDLQQEKLLFYTYVSHGIKSGVSNTTNFSNKYNSRASSMGVYKTEQSYYGRDGLSLRLEGLDRGFNDNASNRSVVMHGGWYVQEDFIKKYGRAGRSWGCPALPLEFSTPIINTIKDRSFLVVYYPSDNWFTHSKFLKCDKIVSDSMSPLASTTPPPENESREDILFVDGSAHKSRLDERSVLALAADRYQAIFHAKVPLERMLRRQINQMEYIALSIAEFNLIRLNPDNQLNEVRLVKPSLVMKHGYYETQMQILNLGKIKTVDLKMASSKMNEQTSHYTIYFEKNSLINLKSTKQFVRWVGL